MPRKKMSTGTIRFPKYKPGSAEASADPGPVAIDLPPNQVLNAGVEKFMEMARLYWPAQEGGFKLASFDIRNDRQLRMTLALVYLAMKDAADQ